MGLVFAVTDDRNNDIVGGLAPIIIGFIVFVLGRFSFVQYLVCLIFCFNVLILFALI